MQFSDFYFLGTVTKTNGLKGHVTVKLDTDEPELYYKMESVFVEINPQQLVPFFIQEITVLQPNSLKILFETDSPNNLVGCALYKELKDLPTLDGKKFYYHEVIGFKIKTKQQVLGEITAINDSSAQALFVFAQADSEEQYLPIVNDWIVEVNRKDKVIEMQLPEGLTNIYSE